MYCTESIDTDSDWNVEKVKQTACLLGQYQLTDWNFVYSINELIHSLRQTQQSRQWRFAANRLILSSVVQNAETNGDVELTRHVGEFGEEVFGKLLAARNSIPSVLIAPHSRVKHDWKDVLFIFSHRFQGLLKDERVELKSPFLWASREKGKWCISSRISRQENYKSIYCFI